MTTALSPDRPALAFPVMGKAAATFGALVFLMFMDMLLAPGSYVLGNAGTDMFLQFYSWREFGFDQLAHGNLALWNPHIFGGAPFFGETQAAMLYPTNLLLLFLPLAMGINWSIALNVWLLGMAMYVWAGYRGLKPLACFVAGVVLMFCGPHFMHVYSGHPVHMAVMTWAPVIFLAIDGIFESRGRLGLALRWALVGMAAVAFQVLGGHPQYLFYTAIAAGFYTLWGMARIALDSKGEGMANVLRQMAIPGIGLGVIFAGGSLLTAVQLFTAIQANGETIRAIPVPFEFAAMFGFPPENLLTLLNPYFFGDMQNQAYWGRCYLWEMSLFIGTVSLVLAVYGAIFGRGTSRFFGPGRLAGLALITFIFALGVHTPLFQFLYAHVPGFGKFRGISKFTFQSVLFLGMLSAMGLDALLRDPKVSRKFVIGTAIAGGVVLLASIWITLLGPSGWQPVLKAVQESRESYLPPAAFASLEFGDHARGFAAGALFIPALILLGVAGILHYVPRSSYAVPTLVVLLTTELFIFAYWTRETVDTKTIAPAALADFVKTHPGNYRSLNLLNPNAALSLGAYDIWGADPGVERRYAEFMTWSQGGDPDNATQYISFADQRGSLRIPPFYTMLRFRYAFIPTSQGIKVAQAPAAPMEQVQLVHDWRVIPQRDAIFRALRDPVFDPRREVILESDPGLAKPPTASTGTARVTASSTDWLEIEADTSAPAILFVTDAYSSGWRARALPGSSQQSYQVLPANYILRGVPLGAGHHRLRIEYVPRAFTVGLWVSLISLIAYIAAVVLCVRQGRKCHGNA
ncbi:MAG: hypothetical protein ACFUZC_22085 [Chthoniobacteraceae bacterium]